MICYLHAYSAKRQCVFWLITIHTLLLSEFYSIFEVKQWREFKLIEYSLNNKNHQRSTRNFRR
jgi:hypothetical protein